MITALLTAAAAVVLLTVAGAWHMNAVLVERDRAREGARHMAETFHETFAAAPVEERTCRWCYYRPICGPYEALRSARKPASRLAALRQVRQLP